MANWRDGHVLDVCTHLAVLHAVKHRAYCFVPGLCGGPAVRASDTRSRWWSFRLRRIASRFSDATSVGSACIDTGSLADEYFVASSFA